MSMTQIIVAPCQTDILFTFCSDRTGAHRIRLSENGALDIIRKLEQALKALQESRNTL